MQELRNDEWDLALITERLAADLDSVRDTLALKAVGRGVTFGPKSISLEVRVTARYDCEQHRFLFRALAAGEPATATLRFEIVPSLRDELQAHGVPFCGGRDTSRLDQLPGVSPDQIDCLERCGILSVGDLRAVAVSDETRAMLAVKTGASREQIDAWVTPSA
jgi:hypothetical protein